MATLEEELKKAIAAKSEARDLALGNAQTARSEMEENLKIADQLSDDISKLSMALAVTQKAVTKVEAALGLAPLFG